MSSAQKCQAKNPELCRHHGTPKAPEAKAPSPHLKQSIGGGKSNTSASEKLFLAAVIAISKNDSSEVERLCKEIVLLDIERKFLVARNLETEGIRRVTNGLYAAIKKELKRNDIALTSSSNNKLGSDLEESNTGISIETKFGGGTDFNIGMASAKILFPKAVVDLFPTNADRIRWRTMWKEGEISDQDLEHMKKLQTINLLMGQQTALDSAAQHSLNCFYEGINSGSEIASLSQNPSQLKRKIIRLEIDPRTLLWKVSKKKALVDLMGWTLTRSEHTGKRLNIFFTHNNGAEVKIVYNYKNTYNFNPNKSTNRDKAKDIFVNPMVGLGSPSFNGFIKAFSD